MAVIVSVIALGIAGTAYFTESDSTTNPQVDANVQTLVNQNKEIDTLTDRVKDVDSEQKIQINALTARVLELEDDHADLKSQQLENNLAIKALSSKTIILDNTPPKKTFELLTLDNQAQTQDVFLRDQAVYITGNADQTNKQELTVKIRNHLGQIVSDRTVGIPENGRFTVVYVIPTSAMLGV